MKVYVLVREDLWDHDHFDREVVKVFSDKTAAECACRVEKGANYYYEFKCEEMELDGKEKALKDQPIDFRFLEHVIGFWQNHCPRPR